MQETQLYDPSAETPASSQPNGKARYLSTLFIFHNLRHPHNKSGGLQPSKLTEIESKVSIRVRNRNFIQLESKSAGVHGTVVSFPFKLCHYKSN